MGKRAPISGLPEIGNKYAQVVQARLACDFAHAATHERSAVAHPTNCSGSWRRAAPDVIRRIEDAGEQPHREVARGQAAAEIIRSGCRSRIFYHL
jgi:hypothetical protein